jgi:hypothetical protein
LKIPWQNREDFFMFFLNKIENLSRKKMNKEAVIFNKYTFLFSCLVAYSLSSQTVDNRTPQLFTEGPPVKSGGSFMSSLPMSSTFISDKLYRYVLNPNFSPANIITNFEGFNFTNNAIENAGRVFIPPDPIGAAGIDRLIAVVNVMIEAQSKSGTLLWRDALKDFFHDLSPQTYTFDPKVIYDHYEDRFLVVVLEKEQSGRNPDPENKSRIFLAVSKDGTPKSATAEDWYYHEIIAKTLIGTEEYWADYPGFEVDEEAIYITANMFSFEGGSGTNKTYLWIIDKGTSDGFYAGSSASVAVYDPFASNSGIASTTMPAQVFGANGAGIGVGTYLVTYSGLSKGTTEFIQIVRINNPLGTPSFYLLPYVSLGDIENNIQVELPDAPQLGSDIPIEVNDRRALDCVWRNNVLWLITTINPRTGPDAGQTTAHWIKISTSGTPTLIDQGNIGGEDIALNTFTFYPSIAVNSAGDAMFGFSASAATIYAGAYVTGRQTEDSDGIVQASETVKAGEDHYVRTFGDIQEPKPNRWGDYSGISLDPTNDQIFWVFNEYAAARGDSSNGEDGRWGTVWASCSFYPVSISLSNQSIPDEYTLFPNYPNPFNPSTTISFFLPEAQLVNLEIFDSNGRKIRSMINESKHAGFHQLSWDGSNEQGKPAVSGLYIFRIRAGGFVNSRKMLLLK